MHGELAQTSSHVSGSEFPALEPLSPSSSLSESSALSVLSVLSVLEAFSLPLDELQAACMVKAKSMHNNLVVFMGSSIYGMVECLSKSECFINNALAREMSVPAQVFLRDA
jgi:hypothetical protein